MKMKSMMVMAVALTIWAGCAETAQEQKTPEGAAAPAANDLSANPDYKKGLTLVAQSDCLTCHAINETTTGPAYADIAAKYEGADDAQISKLAQTIIKGGSGNWGAVPMTPHPDVSEDDAKQMVKYILLLKK